MYPLWEQIKSFIQSISRIVHKQAETLDRTTSTLDKTTVTANEAHEAASYSRQRIDGKMDAANPIGTGAFIMNFLSSYQYGEKSSSLGIGKATGRYAHAENEGIASGIAAHAEGSSKASGVNTHAEGDTTSAGSRGTHAEGGYTSADWGYYAHAEGEFSQAKGKASHAEGSRTVAPGDAAHAEGKGTRATADFSHAEGYCTNVFSENAIAQHVQGKANIRDEEGKYAHIVGNGEATQNVDGTFTIEKYSNAHTIDWNGNAWFQGEVYVGGEDQGNGAMKLVKNGDEALTLKSPDGSLFTITVGNDGTLSAAKAS